MFIRNSTWNRIRAEFSDEEKAAFREALCGETICPPGCILYPNKLPDALLSKLKAAVAFAEPGA